MDSLCRANLHFSKELQGFRGGHGFCETVGSESNRPRVFREQKVLPEVRNRPLLLREFFSFSIFEIYGSTIGVCNIPMEEHSVTCKMDSTD